MIGDCDELLILFAREPMLGKVKTRLAADSNDSYALAVYQRLLTRSLRLASRLIRSRAPNSRTQLMVAGEWGGGDASRAQHLSEFCSRTGASLWSQRGTDLGTRMREAFKVGFDAQVERIVLMGCDSPSLSFTDLSTAFDSLVESDVVIAPTIDGGYSLIGLKQPTPRLFESMTWSVPSVLSETLSRAQGLSVKSLSVQLDIDHLKDWQRWCEHRAGIGLAEAIEDLPKST